MIFSAILDDYYSYLRLSTGFAVAALIACELIVTNAITSANVPDNMNIHGLTAVL